MPELLGQSETVSHMFRRYKVLSHFDAAVEVVHLGGVRRRITVMWAQTRMMNRTASTEAECCSTGTVADLVRCSSRDKHSISQKLYNGPTLDAILFIEPAAQHLVQVPALVVDGVVVWRILLSLLLPHLPQVHKH